VQLQEYAKIQQEKRDGGRLVIPLVKEHLLKNWNQQDLNPHFVHPSEMAKKDWCERATYYRICSGWTPPERFNFNLQIIFDEGHQIHDKWQTWLRESGRLYGRWECDFCHAGWLATSWELGDICKACRNVSNWRYAEVPLTYGIVTGHEDAAVDDRLIEFKSVGIGVLRIDNPMLLSKFYHKEAKLYDLDGLWKALDKPLSSHLRQANVYLWLAQKMGLDFPKCSLVYEYKPNQQVKEFVISPSEAVMSPLLDKVGHIEYALETGVAPRCPYKGCKHCEPYEQSGSPQLPDRIAECVQRLAEGERARPARTEVSRSRDAGPTRRRNGTQRQQSDEAVPPADGIPEVSGDTASVSGSRRKVFRTKDE
jgi:hypothetical protein